MEDPWAREMPSLGQQRSLGPSVPQADHLSGLWIRAASDFWQEEKERRCHQRRCCIQAPARLAADRLRYGGVLLEPTSSPSGDNKRSLKEAAGSAEGSSFRWLQSCIQPELQCQSGRVTSLTAPGRVRRSKTLASVEISTSTMPTPLTTIVEPDPSSTEAGIPRLFRFAIIAVHAVLGPHSRNRATTETAAVSGRPPIGTRPFLVASLLGRAPSDRCGVR